MPNWTYNEVVITGTIEDVDNFMETIIVNDDEYSLTQCNPMPNELVGLYQGYRTIDGVKHEIWYEDEDGPRPMLDMVKEELIEKYGTCQPIDWQYLNWGTKWGDCRTELVEETINKKGKQLIFRYESAWGEPFRLLNDIAIKFNLEITNHWNIEMNQGNGVSEYPWTPEDTEQVYNEHQQDYNNIINSIRSSSMPDE